MSLATVKILGDIALIAKLQTLERAPRNKILRPAITSGARFLRSQLKPKIPVDQGNLQRTIDFKVKTKKSGIYAVVGPRSDLVLSRRNLWGKTISAKPNKYAHLIENGAKPHVLLVGKNRRIVWNHPGTKPTKIFSRTFSYAAPTAFAQIQANIKSRLEAL